MFLRSAEAERDCIYLEFSTTEKINLTLNQNLFVTPAIKNLNILPRWDAYGVRLQGDLKPETEYTITVKKGTRSKLNHVLLADTTVKAKTPALSPYARFSLSHGQMAFTPETSLPCKYLACDELIFKAWKAFPNNIVHYGQTTWRDELLEQCATYTYKMPLDKKQMRRALLPIYDILKGEPGVYRFTLSTKKGHEDECYIILSNLGATYAYDETNAPIVTVQSILDGAPVKDATVHVYDSKHQLIATGVSDEEGIAITDPTQLALERQTPSVPDRIIITSGKDLTIIECDSSTQHSAYLPDGSKLPDFPSVLWPDRDGIHPGERVQIYGLIRDANLLAVNEMPITLEVKTPDNHTLLTQHAVSNPDGYFCASFTIPKGGKSGYYSVQAKMEKETLAETELYVSDFTPNHVRLSLAFQEGQPHHLVLTPSTYFGSPITKGSGTLTINGCYATLPKEWRHWTIGTQQAVGLLKTHTFVKDDESPTYVLDGVDNVKLMTFNAPLQLTATTSFSEPNSRAVTTSTTLNWSPRKAYLAMRYEYDEKTLYFRQYVPEGNDIQPDTIQLLSLKKITSRYVHIEKNNRWHYSWVTEEEEIPLTDKEVGFTSDTIQLTSDTIQHPLNELPSGHYVLTAKLNGAMTTLSFWHSVYYTGKALSHPSTLVFETDKTSYNPGETAQLTFNAPTDGRVIVVCGDTELQHVFTTDVTAGSVTLPVPISTATSHGCWTIGVTLIAKNLNTEARYFGVAKLPINHDYRHLNVNISLPEVAKPQEEITLTLNLNDHTGAPTRGTVALFAVDEAVLNVTGFKTPDPSTLFFQRDGSPFLFGDIYGSLLPQLRLSPDGHIGGDALQRRRRAIDDSIDVSETTTVITFPLQEIDETGQLTIPLQLPDFKGTLRFMAVVSNATCVGSADQEIIVRPPATLTSSGVRYGCAGDQAEFTFRVINHDLPAGPYTLTVGDQTVTGEITPNGTRYHTFMLPLETYTATLQLGDFTTQTTHKVTLQEEVPTYLVTRIKHLAEGETLPEGAEPLESLEAIRQIALAWLGGYPYTCTEQLSSRMLPYTDTTLPEERSYLQALFSRVSLRLTPTGAYSLWDDKGYISPEASLLASYVLIESQKAGNLSASNDIKAVMNYLYAYANSQNTTDRDCAAYASFLLGEVGFSDLACLAARNLLITEKTDTAAFVAAATLVFNGAADEGAPIMKDYLNANPIPKRFFGYYMNEVARQGFVLAFAIRAGVCSDEEILQRLNFLLQSPWETPQANAWAAIALKACEALPEGTQLYRYHFAKKTIPENAPIKVKKTIVDRNGTPVTTLNHGDLAFVDIEIQMPHACDDLILRDRLPGGLEYEDANLATRESATLPNRLTQNRTFLHLLAQENLGAELRFFGKDCSYRFDHYPRTIHQIYPVRATAKGTFAIPAAIVEDMYDATFTGGYDPAETLTIQ